MTYAEPDMQGGDDEQPVMEPQAFIEAVTQSENLAAEMPEDQLTEIAQQVIGDYDMDKASMQDWFKRMERGLELAKLTKDQKDYPFTGAANIKYPLVTSAALQFNARAYPAICAPDRMVKAKVWGADPQGIKAARAERISEHMSWQLSAQISEWEEETDKLLTQLPIVGTMIRKWWYDPTENRPRCRTVMPGKFIVNEKVKVLDEAPRCTEELSLYPVEIESRKRNGMFVSDFEPDVTGRDEQEPQDFIEQHTRLDLDEDGYPEPYVVMVHPKQHKVVRIVADFSPDDVRFSQEDQPVPVQVQVADPMTGQPMMMTQIVQQPVITGIAAIRRGTYFVAHQFLPSMDGGFWGTGLGLLLGDISETINSIINMMMDSGHYNSLGGGFIGADLRMKGGAQRVRPGEWRQVASTGAEIKNAIVPMQFSGPDATMYQLLGMLIEAGREIASVKDVVTGETPKNQTATATLAAIEQGMMVFTAAYKRIFRACKAEYGMLAKINADTLDAQTYSAFHDEMGENGEGQQLDPRADYDLSDMDVQPVADPRSVTKMQQAAKAEMVMQMAQQGLADPAEASRRMAEAMDLEDVEDLMPKPDPAQQEMEQQMMAFQMESAQADVTQKKVEIELTLAKIEETRAQAIENLAGAQNDQQRAQTELMKVKLDGLRTVLNEERARLDSLFRRTGGMEGQSGDGNAARGNAPAGGGA